MVGLERNPYHEWTKTAFILDKCDAECIAEGATMQEYQNVRYLSPYYDSDTWAKAFVDSEDERAALKMICHMFRYNSKLVQYVLPIVGGGKKTQGGYNPLPTSGYKYPELGKDNENVNQEVKQDLDKLIVYEKTLERCREKGVALTIFVSPSYIIKGKQYIGAVDKLSEIANKYGYELKDYSSAPHFMSDKALFKDASHLNDNGARMYTQMVIENMRNINN